MFSLSVGNIQQFFQAQQVKFCMSAKEDCESHAILLRELPFTLQSDNGSLESDNGSRNKNLRRLIINPDYDETESQDP